MKPYKVLGKISIVSVISHLCNSHLSIHVALSEILPHLQYRQSERGDTQCVIMCDLRSIIYFSYIGHYMNLIIINIIHGLH